MFERLACRLASWSATPWAIGGVPLFCALWLYSGVSINVLTLMLSVLALTLTQLVLAAQQREERNLKMKVKEILRAVPGADEAVAPDD